MSGALEVCKPVDLASVLGRADVAATCPHANVDRSGEPRGVRDEGVELAVLTAGVHSARQIANERLIVGPAAKLLGKEAGIDAHADRLHSAGENLRDDTLAGPVPERQSRRDARPPARTAPYRSRARAPRAAGRVPGPHRSLHRDACRGPGRAAPA